MAFYLVSQGDTFEQEMRNGYLWQRKSSTSDSNSRECTVIHTIKKGDVFFHNNSKTRKIVAISFAKEDSKKFHLNEFSEKMQKAYRGDKATKTDDGYYVSLEIHDLTNPIENKQILDFSRAFCKRNLVRSDDIKKIRYILEMKDEEVKYVIHLLNEKGDVEKQIKKILFDMDSAEIDNLTPNANETIELRTGGATFDKEVQGRKNYYCISPKETDLDLKNTWAGKKVSKLNSSTAAEALSHADYKCEYDKNHHTFTRKNGKPYTEPHHLVPLSKNLDFPSLVNENKYISLDVPNNIVSLCSHCHKLLHYGCMEEKEPVLAKLYKDRQKLLEDAGIKITFEELKNYYL